MRNIRTRRRFGLIINLLLVVCVILFIEDRIEAFVPQMKSLFESRIENAFGGRIGLSIGDVEGGLIHPVTFNDIRIRSGKGAALISSLNIRSIKTNYRLWDLLRVGTMSKFFSGVTRLDVNFLTANKSISGFVRLANASGKLDAKGYVILFSGRKIDFSGSIKDGIYNIEVKPARGLFKAEGTISKEGLLAANFKAYHLDIAGADLVCDGTLKSEISASGVEIRKPVLQGAIETKNCILNYKPFLNLKASYRISDENLFISDFNLSDILRGGGTFQLREPFNTNATLLVNNLSLSWLALALGAKDAPAVLSGTMNAKLDLKGPIADMRSDIRVEIRKGMIATLEFESLNAYFKGDGTLIRIEDSHITRESGSFVIAGDMDLKKLGKSTMFDNIRLVGDDRAVNWDGWDMSKVQNMREVTMKKRLTDELDLDFKKFTSEDSLDENSKYGDEVQLEYKLHPNDSLKVMVGQDKEFLGIEHKNRF
jgi:hypothetical protein